jgi:hypothetical protein
MVTPSVVTGDGRRLKNLVSVSGGALITSSYLSPHFPHDLASLRRSAIECKVLEVSLAVPRH